MPETATVTTYYDFSGGRRAVADQVDANLANHRGHVIPIDPNTAAAAHNTYDLGSTEYQWRRAYLRDAPYIAGIQTNRFEIEDVYDGSVATEIVDPVGDLERIAFPADRDTDVRFQFVVPPLYTPGNRIALALRGYPETTGSAVFYSTSRLHSMSLTSIVGTSTPAAVLTGTATIANASAGLVQNDSSLKLTDANGLINGVTVTVGDLITVGLKRATSALGDTNTGRWFAVGLSVDLNN